MMIMMLACLAGAGEAGLRDSNTAIYEQHLWVGDWFCYFQFSPLTDRRSSPYSMESLGLQSAPPRLGLGAEHGGGTLLPWLSVPTKMSVITWPVYWYLIGWKADHVTCILIPDWLKSWSRDQTPRSPQKCCHSPRPADRKNALWVPFRGVTIFNIPSVPFHQGKWRSLIPRARIAFWMNLLGGGSTFF